jgi:acyl-CoA oxidase
MLTQQTGRYLFKTFRTILSDPNAEMSRENLTAHYVRKVRSTPSSPSLAL